MRRQGRGHEVTAHACPKPATDARQPANEGTRRWWEIRQLAVTTGPTSAAEILLYGQIGDTWWEEGVTAEAFVSALAALDVDRINLRINSPGGNVFQATAIYNALVRHRAVVDVTVDGIAASAASFIAQAGDTVTMGRGSTMMIHDASGGCLGTPADMREMATVLDTVSDNIAGIYADRTGTPAETWRETMRCGDTWYNAEQAVEAGLADMVAPAPTRERDQAPEPTDRAPEMAAPADGPTTPTTTDDDWAATVAALTTPPDDWAALVAQLGAHDQHAREAA